VGNGQNFFALPMLSVCLQLLPVRQAKLERSKPSLVHVVCRQQGSRGQGSTAPGAALLGGAAGEGAGDAGPLGAVAVDLHGQRRVLRASPGRPVDRRVQVPPPAPHALLVRAPLRTVKLLAAPTFPHATSHKAAPAGVCRRRCLRG